MTDTVFDRLNDAIRQAEHALAALKPARAVFVEISQSEYLGFQKIDDKWSITLTSREPIHKALTSVPIENRVRAARSIPLLATEILRNKAEFTKEVEEVTNQLHDWMLKTKSGLT